ncbi:putative pectinesterase/pectinesterase inhibitor 40, partial [Cucurbita argyrosperma subsp. sororia]
MLRIRHWRGYSIRVSGGSGSRRGLRVMSLGVRLGRSKLFYFWSNDTGFGTQQFVTIEFLNFMDLVIKLFPPTIKSNKKLGLSHGKGDYVSIGAAIAAASNNSNSRFDIHVKPGLYYEYIKVESSQTFITLTGDDASTTTIVGNRSQDTDFGTSTN